MSPTAASPAAASPSAASPAEGERRPSRGAAAEPPVVLRVSDPRELLALVPHQLGFRPQRSLVLVCLRGERRRVGLVVRADLPEVGAQERRDLSARRVDAGLVERVGAVVDRLVDLAVRDGAAAVVAVVYDDPGEPDLLSAAEDPRETGLPGLVELLLGGACASAGVRLADAWWVDGRRYRSLGCRDERCCPADGAPLEALSGTVVAAEMVSRGSSPADSRGGLLDDLRPALGERRRDAARSAESARRRARRAAGDPGRAARVRAEALARFRSAVGVERLAAVARSSGRGDLPVPPGAGRAPAGPPPPGGPGGERHDPALLGRLGAALRDPWLRDAVLVCCLPGAGDLPEQMVATGPDARAEELLEGVVGDPRGAREPDAELLDPATAVLAAVVRHLPGAAGAEALAALAWSAWWCGDGARAVACAERALEARAGTSMAELVLDLVDAGAAPAWVRARRALETSGG